MSELTRERGPSMSTPMPAFIDLRLVPAALAVWAGCWWGTGAYDRPFGYLAILSVVMGLFVIAVLAMMWRRREETARPEPRHRLTPSGSVRSSLALVCVATAGACLLAAQARATYEADPFHQAFLSHHSLECDVEIIGYPRAHHTGSSFSGKSATLPARTVRIYLKDGRAVASSVEVRIRGKGMMAFQRGDRLRIRVKPAARQRLPAPVAAELQMTRLIERSPARGLSAIPAVIRAHTHAVLASASPDAQGLIPGIAMGDRSALPAQLNKAMQAASMTHLSAISGMHIAVLLTGIALIVPGRGVLRITAIVCALTTVILLAGPTASVLRSVTMAAIGAWGLLSRRSGQGLASLAVAAIVMLYADPWNARSFSFALSTAATAGVVLHGRRWQEWGTRRFQQHTALNWAACTVHAMVSVPLAAQIWVMPVMILMEPQLPLWGVAANVAVAPVVAPLTFLSLVVCLGALAWPGLSMTFLALADPLCTWVAGIARSVAAFPHAQIPWVEGIDGAILWCVMLMIASGGIKVVMRVGHWKATRTPAGTTHRGEHGAT